MLGAADKTSTGGAGGAEIESVEKTAQFVQENVRKSMFGDKVKT